MRCQDVQSTKRAEVSAGHSAKSHTESYNQGETGRWTFKVAFIAICLIGFIATLDLSVIATALPRITDEIDSHTNEYVWMANCFILAQTVVQLPLAQLCDIFGRRSPLLVSLALFMLGSGIAGGSATATMFIAGRTIQGVGSGGIVMLIEIVVCDLVPMRQRGKYLGIVLAMCSIGAVLGPIVGGALANVNWRWIFYLNIPVAGLVSVVIRLFLRFRYVKAPWKNSLSRVDWLGSTLFVSSTCAVLFGLIAGGTQFPWPSWRVILPLILGSFGLILFCIYEAKWCREPGMPTVLFHNRTSVTGFLLTTIVSTLIAWVSFYLPLYFQSVREASPLRSGVLFLPFQVFFVPSATIAGFVLTKTGLYKPVHLTGCALAIIGIGLFTMLSSKTHIALQVVFQAITAVGLGCIIPTLLPAIQSSLEESQVAASAGMFSFLRSFGYVWGITIPGIVFDNRFTSSVSQINDTDIRTELGNAYQFASNMYKHPFDEHTRETVVLGYSDALKAVWVTAIPFAAIAFLLVFLEKQLALREELTTRFGLEEDL